MEIAPQLTEEAFARLSPATRKNLIYQAMYFEKLKEQNRLPFFIPDGSQEDFIREVGTTPDTGKKVVISTAANGVGKTCAVINIFANLIYGCQSKWFDHPLFRNPWTFPKNIWFLSEHDAFQNNITPEIRKWLPKDSYDANKAGRKFDSVYNFRNGWTMFAKTYDQAITQFESDTVGLIIYNEPPPQVIRNACVSRLRMGGLEIFAMTPLDHSAWIFDELIENTNQQKHVSVLYADIEEACIVHGRRGFLAHEQIEYMASQMDPDEKEARLHGKPKHLSGKIYKTLHPERHKHYYDPNFFKQDENDIYCVMDIHDRRPPAIVWFAANVNGKKFAVDEYPNDPSLPYHQMKSTSLTYEDFAKEILTREKDNGWDSRRIRRFMDPNYGRRQMGVLGITIQQFFAQPPYNLFFMTDIVDDIMTGHIAVKNLLDNDVDGTPNLLIGDKLVNSWYQLSRYGIKEHSARKQETDGLSERVAQKYKDFADVFRYFAVVCVNPRQKQEVSKIPPLPREADTSVPSQENWATDWRNPFSPRTTITRHLK